jgi:hypothetical protein
LQHKKLANEIIVILIFCVSDSQAKKKKFEHSNGNVQTKLRVRHSSSPPATVSRKESFTAEGLVTNIDDFEDSSRLPSQKLTNDERESRGKFLSNWKRKKPHQQVEQTRSHDLLSSSSDRRKKSHQQVEQTRSHDLLSSASDRSGCQTLPHGHLPVYSTEDERGRRSTSLPPSAQTGVQDLWQQFESLSSSSPSPPVTPEDADMSHVTPSKHHMVTSSGMDTEAGTRIRMGRRNSNGNSDSGRESMILESETVQQHV